MAFIHNLIDFLMLYHISNIYEMNGLIVAVNLIGKLNSDAAFNVIVEFDLQLLIDFMFRNSIYEILFRQIQLSRDPGID